MEKMKENTYYCAKCNKEMLLEIVPKYEFTSGFPLLNVPAHVCEKCGNVFFTEEQAREMKTKTKEMIERTFSFERKVTISGKSLVVGIPSELAAHLHIKKGQKVRIIPVASEGILIKKA